MDVRELYDFSKWFLNYGGEATTLYRTMQTKLEHNSTQPAKEPVLDELKQLLKTLREMPLHELTNEQLSLLEQEGVGGLVGSVGAKNVERIVKSARFDPASAHLEFQKMHASMSETQAHMQIIKDSLSSVVSITEEEPDFEHITIRIHFKESASISDVVEWKEWSNEWYDIVRGIAICVDEPPENVKVLGAHQGSVIMVLGATAAVTSLLLLISNHLTKIALNGLQVANGIQDLKHKVKLNKALIDGLEKSVEQSEKDAIKTLISEAKASLPSPINGEQETALKKSVEKYQKFTTKGGEVDFISPPEPDKDTTKDLNEGEIQQITNVRENIEQLRDAREETRLLTNQSGEEEDFEDEDLNDEVE